jgi:hypothetical protein
VIVAQTRAAAITKFNNARWGRLRIMKFPHQLVASHYLRTRWRQALDMSREIFLTEDFAQFVAGGVTVIRCFAPRRLCKAPSEEAAQSIAQRLTLRLALERVPLTCAS